MSQEVFEPIKRGFASWNEGDWDAALEGFAEDAVWTAVFAPVSGERSLFGRDAIKRAWVSAAEVLGGPGTYHAEALKYRDLGAGTVLVVLELSGQGTVSGVATARTIAQLWTLRNGLAARVDSYGDEAEALEAAGAVSGD